MCLGAAGKDSPVSRSRMFIYIGLLEDQKAGPRANNYEGSEATSFVVPAPLQSNRVVGVLGE